MTINHSVKASQVFVVLLIGLAAAVALGMIIPGVRLRGSVPPIDLSHFESAPSEMNIRMTLYFALRNRQELENRVAAEGNPTSPTYGQSIPKEEIEERYKPLPSDETAVKSWLESCGFTIVAERYGLPVDYIEFTGPVALAEQVLEVPIVSDSDKYTNTADPMIPTQFQGIIAYVSLNNVGEARPASGARPAIVPPASTAMP